jgi:hypothetical protein
MPDIKTLKDLEFINGLYELEGDFFVDGKIIGIYSLTLTERHAGRPWLVSADIFDGKIDQIDLLCSINGIFNPLTMNVGDVIYYTDPSNPESSRSNIGSVKKVIAQLKTNNAGKSQKNDNNRAKDKSVQKQRENNKKSTTPVLPNLANQNQNIQYGEGSITLKPNF